MPKNRANLILSLKITTKKKPYCLYGFLFTVIELRVCFRLLLVGVIDYTALFGKDLGYGLGSFFGKFFRFCLGEVDCPLGPVAPLVK